MYIVDGYNLLHACRRKPGLLPAAEHEARARLIELLSAMARRESTKARVFFDGTGSGVRAGDLAAPGIRVTFCGPIRESADAAILGIVEESNHPRKLTVISDDREVAQACRLAGARTLSSREVAAKLEALSPPTRPSRKPEKPSRGAGPLEEEMLKEIGDWESFRREIEKDLE
jgi:predicted RNA-binding protein with PIN domain